MTFMHNLRQDNFALELHMFRTNSSFLWQSLVLLCKLQSRTGGKLVKKLSGNEREIWQRIYLYS